MPQRAVVGAVVAPLGFAPPWRGTTYNRHINQAGQPNICVDITQNVLSRSEVAIAIWISSGHPLVVAQIGQGIHSPRETYGVCGRKRPTECKKKSLALVNRDVDDTAKAGK